MNSLIAFEKRIESVFYPMIVLRYNEAVMGCIMHSMMFEAQMRDIFQHVSKKGVKSKEKMDRGKSRKRGHLCARNVEGL